MQTKPHSDDNAESVQNGTPQPPIRRRGLRIAGRIAGGLVIILLLAGIGAYILTPAAIRRPSSDHYHFRTQIIVNGKAVNFAHHRFQEGYSKDNCSAELTNSPFHFHDSRDQLTHVHWDNLTGGQLLKYYGWNRIGGVPNNLGYRFDTFPKLQSVPIHGNVLPQLPDGEQLYIFTGDQNGFKQHDTKDFLKQDLETFFGKRSNLEKQAAGSWLDSLFPRASAHGHPDHADEGHSEAELEDINNLLGNVVIFAQKERPTDDEVQARFAYLVPLEASTCGG